MILSDEQLKMMNNLDIHLSDIDEFWLEVIDRLIKLEKEKGSFELFLEINSMMSF